MEKGMYGGCPLFHLYFSFDLNLLAVTVNSNERRENIRFFCGSAL